MNIGIILAALGVGAVALLGRKKAQASADVVPPVSVPSTPALETPPAKARPQTEKWVPSHQKPYANLYVYGNGALDIKGLRTRLQGRGVGVIDRVRSEAAGGNWYPDKKSEAALLATDPLRPSMLLVLSPRADGSIRSAKEVEPLGSVVFQMQALWQKGFQASITGGQKHLKYRSEIPTIQVLVVGGTALDRGMQELIRDVDKEGGPFEGKLKIVKARRNSYGAFVFYPESHLEIARNI